MRKLALVFVAVTGIVLAGGCFLLNVSEGSAFPRPMAEGELTFSNPPALDQTAVLVYRIENIRPPQQYKENGLMVSARIVLPEGLVWVSGGENSLIWENRYLIENLRTFENVPAEISGVVKAIETGRWTVEAFITYVDTPLYITMRNIENVSTEVPWWDELPSGWWPSWVAGPWYEGGALITLNVSENSAYVENGVYWAGVP